MCGIVGWINRQENLQQAEPVIRAMTAALAHRGPDDEGIWLAHHAAIGHRRLIVVDPAGGGQPMVRRCGEHTYVLTYNGELYNTSELRGELAGKGHRFQGYSDTEALLHAYMEWGPDCLERLNGIFAFAVWDDAAQRLFLARDRLGVKPLFYTVRGGSFLFASELKALLVHPEVPAEIDWRGLAEVFLLGPARTPGNGVFYGISELRAGHYLIHDRTGLTLRRYWQLQSRLHQDDLEITTAKIRELLSDTVRRQLVADVPVCTLLSGGLDSSAISAFAAEEYRRRGEILHTYSIDYEGNDRYFQSTLFQPDSDDHWIKTVSEHLGTEHHFIKLDLENLASSLSVAMRARDLPGMADIDSSLLLFCREIKRNMTVGLSSESADEIFGGYPWFHRRESLEVNIFPWSTMTRDRAGILHGDLREKMRRERYVYRRYQETLAETPRLAGEDPSSARLREICYLNITWFLSTLLERKDRMSMATGLEVRVPFCDHRLVEYVWNIPWDIKSNGGLVKGILRRAMAGFLPGSVLARKKSPYPKTHHPAYLAMVREQLAAILHNPASPLVSLLDREAVQALLRTNAMSFSPAWFGQLMGPAQLYAYLVQVDDWMRHYRITAR